MNDLSRYLADEIVEDYRDGRLGRRAALRRLSGLIGSALAAHWLDAIAQPATVPPRPVVGAAALHVAADDPTVDAHGVTFPGSDATLRGYLARPRAQMTAPLVLVCHEGRGVTPYIEDVTRRIAKAGYVGFAVDLLSREGGTSAVPPDRAPGVLGAAPAGRHVDDFARGLAYARTEAFVRPGRAGIVGFCFGGGIAWRVAAATPEIKAAVPFYGQPLTAAEVPRLEAAVLGIYAGRDERINATIPAIEAAMREDGKTFKVVVYPDVEHGFHNDSADRYNPGAARAAWNETLAWLVRYLRAG